MLIAAATGLFLDRRTDFAHHHQRAIDRVDALLPQTQCGACGYPGCRPYASAIIEQSARINACPPGGQHTVDSLSDLLGRERAPLDIVSGALVQQLAWIDEDLCIGCTKCIPACPVDAIVGARQQMHTVLNEHCTGCELCISPCPVDCIEMRAAPTDLGTWKWPEPQRQFMT